jgi:uncharacterized protein with PQ loop repeat
MALAADLAVAAFAICNSVRVFAYLPQIVTVARDQNGAAAVSCTTWGLFAVSHLSTVAYAVLAVEDWRMSAVFASNLLCCLLILAFTLRQRARQAGARIAGERPGGGGFPFARGSILGSRPPAP